MEHLKINKLEDSKYDINWVAGNTDTVFINRHYVERHEPTFNGIAIIVQDPEDPEWFMQYAASDEGWMSVSDFTMKGRIFEIIPTMEGIRLVEENIDKIVAEMRETGT